MPSDDMPPNEGEGALQEEEGKCEALYKMPSDDMPPNEGEGALQKGGISMKKILVVGLVCFIVLGISVPVIASNFQQQNERTEAGVIVAETKYLIEKSSANVFLNENMTYDSLEADGSEKESNMEVSGIGENKIADNENNSDTLADNAVANETVGDNIVNMDGLQFSASQPAQTDDVCPYYVDADGDGICDHCVGENQGCANYVDADGDGVCDHCVGRNQSCANYVDADGDGVCDHCIGRNQSCANYVDADGDGICDHCVGGKHGCANYVDADGDGVCDHCVGMNSNNGYGHHGGGHHGRRHH